MADDVEKGLGEEQEDAGDDVHAQENGVDEGVVPLEDAINPSAESTPEHLLTEKTPLTKSGSKGQDEIEMEDLNEKHHHLTPEVVNRVENEVLKILLVVRASFALYQVWLIVVVVVIIISAAYEYFRTCTSLVVAAVIHAWPRMFLF